MRCSVVICVVVQLAKVTMKTTTNKTGTALRINPAIRLNTFFMINVLGYKDKTILRNRQIFW